MNIIFLSPEFSNNHYLFCESLRKLGINVLGIGNAAYDDLRPELTGALDEYYKVDNIEDYAQVYRAVAYYTYHYGKIDRLESLNYCFLDIEAKLRTDFNISGINASHLEQLNSTLSLKKIFRKARANVLSSILIDTPQNAEAFVNEVGYPVLLKADSILSTEAGCLIKSDEELRAFFNKMPDSPYVLEEVVEGTLYSLEGLIDSNGSIVFQTVHQASGQNSALLPELNPYFYSLLEAQPDIEKVGSHILQAADIKSTFFYIQFIRTGRKKLIALDLKFCPHYEHTPDILNYANDINVYAQWANILHGYGTDFTSKEQYHCLYIGRRQEDHYANTHEEILKTYGHLVLQHKQVSEHLTKALGNYGYIFRTTNLNTILSIIDFAYQD